MMHKVINGQAPPYLNDKFKHLDQLHPITLRNTGADLRPPKLQTYTGQRSFSYRGSKIWNSLKHDLKVEPSLESFKRSHK